jgi:hypothetical protein
MAITATIKEGNWEWATKLPSLEDTALKKRTLLKERQLVWLVHDWFKLNPDTKPLDGLQEISDLKRFGDERVFDFLELWRQIVENNTIELRAKQLAVTLVEEMSGSKVLAQDVAYWRRLEDGSEQESYDYLLNCMLRH